MSFRQVFYSTIISLFATTSLQATPITVPTDLSPGDQYRLAFLTTGTRDAEPIDIAVYNAFVQATADAVPELFSLGATWNAIASTASVDARDNTGTAADLTPVYLLNDTILVNNAMNLWNTDSVDLLHPLAIDELGQLNIRSQYDRVWTGTDSTGIASPHPIGGHDTTYGHYDVVDSTYLDYLGRDSHDTNTYRFYGISQVLTVIPEPSSILLLSLAGMGAIVGYPSRARRHLR